VLTVDLGSARLKAFEELVDAVAAMNRARLVVGHRACPDGLIPASCTPGASTNDDCR